MSSAGCSAFRMLRAWPMQVVHGWLAATGFGVLIPLGIVIARTLKVQFCACNFPSLQALTCCCQARHASIAFQPQFRASAHGAGV